MRAIVAPSQRADGRSTKAAGAVILIRGAWRKALDEQSVHIRSDDGGEVRSVFMEFKAKHKVRDQRKQRMMHQLIFT